MWEWLSQEWWRYIWVPMLGLGLPAMVTTWTKRVDQQSAAALRLDTRQEKELARLDADIEELRAEVRAADERADKERARADVWEAVARWWHNRAHDMAHTVLAARSAAATALRSIGKEVPEHWVRAPWLPSLREPWSQTEPRPPVGETPPVGGAD